jgi:hypothetical protein
LVLLTKPLKKALILALDWLFRAQKGQYKDPWGQAFAGKRGEQMPGDIKTGAEKTGELQRLAGRRWRGAENKGDGMSDCLREPGGDFFIK